MAALSINSGTAHTCFRPFRLGVYFRNPNDFVLWNNPTNGGTFTFDATGTFTYTSAPGFVGTDSFTFRGNDGNVFGNIERESGLAHRWPSGDDHQITRLHARGALIQIDEAGGDTGHSRGIFGKLIKPGHHI